MEGELRAGLHPALITTPRLTKALHRCCAPHQRDSGSLDELLRSYAVDVPQLRGRSISRAA